MWKTQSLTPDIIRIVQYQGTDHPFVGEYNDFEEVGSYLCRQCGLALFRSHAKFHSGCGWPSFDQEIKGAIERRMDADGQRTEIRCSRCEAHLGHVFINEGFTPKNTRHCVNSLSLDFVSNSEVNMAGEAIFAAGCFWGVEHFLKQLPGVLKTEVGYIGGNRIQPTYEEVCAGKTKHFEAVRVLYDPTKIQYEALVKYFFEIHDPEQSDGQGPDLGEQYLSAIFYHDSKQQATAEKLIKELEKMGYRIMTRVLPASPFWRAEAYHQDYYKKNGQSPYCHSYIKRFI